jgi:hypothetical protein
MKPKIVKVRFEKKTTYGSEWTGFVKDRPVFTIKRRNFRMISRYQGRYDYDLMLFGTEEVLERSCYLKDVTSRARSYVQSVIASNGFLNEETAAIK